MAKGEVVYIKNNSHTFIAIQESPCMIVTVVLIPGDHYRIEVDARTYKTACRTRELQKAKNAEPSTKEEFDTMFAKAQQQMVAARQLLNT